MNIRDLKFDFIETLSHVGLAAALHQQCFSKPWDEASFTSAMSIPGTVLALASREDEPVAFILYRYIGTAAAIMLPTVSIYLKDLKKQVDGKITI